MSDFSESKHIGNINHRIRVNRDKVSSVSGPINLSSQYWKIRIIQKGTLTEGSRNEFCYSVGDGSCKKSEKFIYGHQPLQVTMAVASSSTQFGSVTDEVE